MDSATLRQHARQLTNHGPREVVELRLEHGLAAR